MALNLDRMIEQTAGMVTGAHPELTLLPEPGPRELWCPVISVDDHSFEPPTLFDRVPAGLRDAAPRCVEENGLPMWEIGGQRFPFFGVDGAVGRPAEQVQVMGMLREQFRPSVWDPDARVRDMDLNGVWASLNFPST